MNRIWYVVSLALVVLLLFEIKILSANEWNPRTFIFETPQGVDPNRGYLVGYDGRFSYQLAINRWGATEGLDQPNFRYQRILYPLVVRILSFGQPDWVPWVMIAVNLAATVLGCASVGWLLLRRNTSPWLALVLVFSIGFMICIRMDLLEPLALGLALMGWLTYESKHPFLAVILFALAGLTKEIGLLFPAALMLWEVLRKNWRQAIALLVGSFLPYFAWYGILYLWFGTSQEAIAKSSPIIFPFWGFRYLTDLPSRVIVCIWVLIPAVVAGFSAGWDFLRQPASESGRDACLVLANVALIAILPAPTWIDPLAILRFGIGLLAALILWLASTHRRVLPYVAGLWGTSGLVLLLVPGMW